MKQIVKTPTILEFKIALQSGRDAIRKAADMLCLIVDSNPNAYRDIQLADPSISVNLLASLERVGRGVMHENLLFDSSPASRRIALMPASQQTIVYSEPVKVVVAESGKFVIKVKPVQQLSLQEVKTFFTETGEMRSIEDQKQVILETPEPKQRQANPAQRYTIIGDKVTILEQTVFTAVQLQEILERLILNGVKTLATKR